MIEWIRWSSIFPGKIDIRFAFCNQIRSHLSRPLSRNLLFLLDKNRYIVCTFFSILCILIRRVHIIFWLYEFWISKLMLGLRCWSNVIVSNIANEIVDVVIYDSNVAAFSPFCSFCFTRILLRVEMNALFATPFKWLRRKERITGGSKVRSSLESMLKDKRLSFSWYSLWALINIEFSNIYLTLASFVQAIVGFCFWIVLFSKL